MSWLPPTLGHFTGTDSTCALDVDSTCHTGGWCFGSTLAYWHVWYAPRIDRDRMLGHRWDGLPIGPFCDWWPPVAVSASARY